MRTVMMRYKHTSHTLDADQLSAFNAIRVIEETALCARNDIYKRYADLCGVKAYEITIDERSGAVSIIELSEK